MKNHWPRLSWVPLVTQSHAHLMAKAQRTVCICMPVRAHVCKGVPTGAWIMWESLLRRALPLGSPLIPLHTLILLQWPCDSPRTPMATVAMTLRTGHSRWEHPCSTPPWSPLSSLVRHRRGTPCSGPWLKEPCCYPFIFLESVGIQPL